MRIACISDTHGQLPDPQLFKGVDAIIHAGDIGPDYKVVPWIQNVWMKWIDVLMELDIDVYATYGNHDDPQKWDVGLLGMPAAYKPIVDTSVWIDDRKVWFSPWSPTFGNWHWMRSEEDLARTYRFIPEDIDILVTHSPMKGWGDRMARGEHVGSTALYEWVKDRPLETIICGHIHEGRGTYVMPNGTEILNVSVVDEQYQPHVDPARFILQW